ncbi:TadE/TadG family type IV pilus assembly protein [Nocardioides sp. WS12]|uniref:TadE/TadG family type IV pilus assembly protein n=1 Tax=Nocardioides sp. WS12 TaxID=2486272 RepID=UPI0015FC950B|nr:TadE/TadG family type IV pilus assembly protein [Nocardioides sp. WS12]
MSRGFARARRDVRGAAAVEFALLLPVLMVLVFGIINYGDMLSVRQSVSQAASEGARAAAVNPGDNAAKLAAGKKAVDAALAAQDQKCSASGCTITIAPCAGEGTKSCATVVVEIDYEGMIAGFGLVLPETLTYTAVARVS